MRSPLSQSGRWRLPESHSGGLSHGASLHVQARGTNKIENFENRCSADRLVPESADPLNSTATGTCERTMPFTLLTETVSPG